MNLAFYTLWTWESGRWHNYFQIFERQSCGKRHTWILVTQQSTFKLKDRNYREEREEWLKHPQRKMCQHYHAEGLWEQIIRKRNPGNKVKERNVGNTCQIEEWTKSYSGKIQVYTSWFFEKKKYVSLSRHWVCCYQRYSVQAMKWYIGGIQPLSGRWSYIIHTIFWHCISEYIKKNPLIIGFLISMTATSIMLSTESNLKAFANRTNTFFSKFKGFSYLLSPCLT